MHALASPHAHGLLLLTPACRTGSTPFQLPPRTEVPPHPCADWGVRSCESACTTQSDGDACLVASVAYAAGIGVRKDSAAMERLELRACELGVAQGCENYANNFRRSADPDETDLAREYYDRACEGGRAESCVWVGMLALRLDANAEPRDPSTAVARHQQACDGGVAWACATLGDLLTFGIGTAPDPARAAESFRKACEGKDTVGCHNLEDPTEHWLTGTEAVLLDPLYTPDPVFVPGQVPAGERVRVVTRTCFTHASSEPVRVRLVQPSGLRSVDALLLGTLQGWRIRARPGRTLAHPVCVLNVFDIQA